MKGKTRLAWLAVGLTGAILLGNCKKEPTNNSLISKIDPSLVKNTQEETDRKLSNPNYDLISFHSDYLGIFYLNDSLRTVHNCKTLLSDKKINTIKETITELLPLTNFDYSYIDHFLSFTLSGEETTKKVLLFDKEKNAELEKILESYWSIQSARDSNNVFLAGGFKDVNNSDNKVIFYLKLK